MASATRAFAPEGRLGYSLATMLKRVVWVTALVLVFWLPASAQQGTDPDPGETRETEDPTRPGSALIQERVPVVSPPSSPYTPQGNPFGGSSTTNPYMPRGNPFGPTSATNPYAPEGNPFMPTAVGRLPGQFISPYSSSGAQSAARAGRPFSPPPPYNPYSPLSSPFSSASPAYQPGQLGDPFAPYGSVNPFGAGAPFDPLNPNNPNSPFFPLRRPRK